jgi:site-specific recombinase XerD
MSALRFLYKKTLKRRDLSFDDLVYPKRPKKLPVVLSPEEIARLIEATPHPCIAPSSWCSTVQDSPNRGIAVEGE